MNDPKAASGGVHLGPNPGAVAAVFMLLFLASLVPVTLLMGETHFPSPLQTPEEVVAYFRGDVGARVWLIVAGFKLPRERARHGRPAGIDGPLSPEHRVQGAALLAAPR
ncbi:hypothetical protein WMF37_31080 [Sorangium sp. So ce291]|uniref:hypothetical protein n=1 Tax=Sorangium sp. So ce291 TaxID=3133294 RepID=UPI003F5E324E